MRSLRVFAVTMLVASAAHADDAAPPARYSIPWQLRPVVAPTVLRVDTSLAHSGSWSHGNATGVMVLTASMRIDGTGPPSAGLAPVVRAAIVGDSGGGGDFAFVNPLFGVAYAWKLDDGVRLNAFGGVVAPLGMDGSARRAGPNARAQFDNALFAVHDFAFVPGFSAAWVKDDATIQGEVTLFHLVRAGDTNAQPEATKTAMTAGVHLGWFAVPELSFGIEVRYQRWLNAPFAVENDRTGDLRDNIGFALGPRIHLPAGRHVIVRPGFAYHRLLDAPLGLQPLDVHVVQLDVPIFFI